MGSRRLSDYGGSRLLTVARYFILGTLAVFFTPICCYPFFPVVIDGLGADSQTIGSAFDAILQIVPNNMLEPFSSANTPQLLLIAIVSGYALAALGDEVSDLKKVLQQANLLGLTIAQRACALVPYFVGLLLFLKIWTHDTSLLEATWLPIILAGAISIIFLAGTILFVSIKMGMSPILLVRKLQGPFLQALRTGSLNYASVDGLVESCKKLLGIDGDFAHAVLPQGLVLCMPTSGIGICVFLFFMAQTQHIDVTFMWLVSALALSIILAVATPPLNGANLLAFVVAFSYLGLPDDAFLVVMVFDIVFSVLCIACDQAILQLETILQAGRMDLLDEDVLRAPLPE
jgi:Na+/H+-dicarboxylate symporter